MNKFFKFCNSITKTPSFGAVVVFSMSFLVSGALIQQTSALDGGIYCNTFDTQSMRSLCLKFNIVGLVLSIALPVILGILTYKIGVDKQHRSRRERLLHG